MNVLHPVDLLMTMMGVKILEKNQVINGLHVSYVPNLKILTNLMQSMTVGQVNMLTDVQQLDNKLWLKHDNLLCRTLPPARKLL